MKINDKMSESFRHQDEIITKNTNKEIYNKSEEKAFSLNGSNQLNSLKPKNINN